MQGKTASAARILSPKQTRQRPLPCLLIQSFFYGLRCPSVVSLVISKWKNFIDLLLPEYADDIAEKDDIDNDDDSHRDTQDPAALSIQGKRD